ncbi:MAG: hypothetical protein ACHQEB_01845 [Chitinophagales bacterium]
MRKFISQVILLFIITIKAAAQNPVEVFARHRDSLPVEHIYVQLDRQAYVAGDTMWFKGYLFSGLAPAIISTNFFIDLLDEKGSIIASKKLAVVNGVVHGNVELPINLVQGIFLVRAYTKWSLNFAQSFIFKKAIPVFNPPGVTLAKNESGFSFEMFPENGKIISGLSNNIAFRATDEQLKIIPIKANLENGKGIDQGSFADGTTGEGVFSLTPVPGEKYVAVVHFPDQSVKRYELSAAIEKGAALTVADHESGKIFSALFSPDLAKETPEVLLLAEMNNEIVLNTKIPVKDNEVSGVINTENLHPGIMHLLMFDNQNNLLAERATFVYSENFNCPVELKTDTLKLSPKAKNVFSFVLPQDVDGEFSISVTDADRELISNNNEDISASLLLQTGANRYIINPKVKGEDAIDLMMLTNEWYGSDWSSFTKKKPALYLDDQYLLLKGKIFEENSSKNITGGMLNMIVQDKNMSQKNYSVTVQPDGRFSRDNLQYEDSARIYYKMISGKKNADPPKVEAIADKAMDNYSTMLPSIDYSSYIKAKQPVLEDEAALKLATSLHKQLLNDANNRIMLPQKSANKTLVVDKNTNKRYATGIFGSSTGRILDFINDPPSSQGINIFDYLQGGLPGLIINRMGGNYTLQSNRSASTNEVLQGNRSGLVAPKVFLDEMESTTAAIAAIPINQIAMVKYYEPGNIMLPGIGISAVLAVWTKNQDDLGSDQFAGMKSFSYPGYSVARSFSSLDYSDAGKNITDTRVTLYWDPNISIKGNKQFSIKFYNSDLAKRLHIVLEGFTSDGRLVHFDKILE